jgi:putative DNA-invertase from lambdoid prophage Rac
MKTAIYVRVSTVDQSFDSQELELKKFCDLQGWTDIVRFSDQLSGASTDRPGLEALLAAVRAQKIERVVVFKLDRLGRSLPHFAIILMELQKHGTALVATSQGIDTSNSNPMGRLQLHVLMAFAEFERELIRERVNAGLAAARKRGKKLGRKRAHSVTPTQVKALQAEGLSLRAIGRKLGVDHSSVRSLLKW